MALPQLNNPTHMLELPSTGEEIEYRPFLVKEQKMLMLAQQSEKTGEINSTVIKLINACTFDKLDAANLPIFDIEYLFCKLRAKSVGETATINVTCPDDKKTVVPVEINMDELDIQMTENHSNKINITDDIAVIMRYPTLTNSNLSEKDTDTDNMLKMINQSVEEIHDGTTINKRVDFTGKELETFLESMNTQQLAMMVDFFATMPKIRKVVEVENPKTKVKSDVILEGLNSFL